mgnify:CR=1 FL=1
MNSANIIPSLSYGGAGEIWTASRKGKGGGTVLSNANSASARFLKDTSQFEKSSWTANLLDPHSHHSRHRLVLEYVFERGV